jgi:polysaccharide deacetylase 2 family uncharacterized protein YibQ
MKKREPAATDAWKDDLLDRPLGLGRTNSGSGFRLPTAAETGSLALGFLVIAGSAWTALQPSGFRVPAPVAVSTPQEIAAAPEPKAMPTVTRGPSSSPDGPSIQRVEPPAAGNVGNVVIIRDPSAVGQDLRVAHIPDADLIQEADEGLLPVRAADGRRPFDVYARAWSGARGARIAIVVGGVGISQTSSQHAVETLPPEVTLGFAPSGNSLDRWMQAARRKGHELVLQVPMEPFDYPNVDPGRNTLRVDAQGGELLRDLRLSLGRITNYVGVMNYMGARFVASNDAMGALMSELGERGLMYLDDGSSARTLAPTLAAPNRVPFAGVDATIDQARDRASILARLDELERTARARGFAIGAGTAFDVTVDTVTSWVAEARRRGIEIVPISALASDPGR